MKREAPPQSPIRRVVAATDRSETADRAVRWAAILAGQYEAELHLVQVLPSEAPADTQQGRKAATRADLAERDLLEQAVELAGSKGKATVVVDDDPAMAVCRVAAEVGADTLVVGNAGMQGRKRFLLGNVPNRISHHAACNVIIVNTTFDGGPVAWTPREDGAAIDAADADPPLIGRAAHIAAVMARHGIKELFARNEGIEAQRSQAKHLREALEELGPTFSKLGQVLSTRPDLLPPPFIEELSRLQDHVPPMTEAEVVVVMEEEFGVPWEDVFEGIDPTPLAAGTIAQVHRARLESGDRVVVKVQRPTAREQITKDLELFRLFVEKASKRPLFHQVIDIKAVFQHLSDSLQRELDFLQEARNIRRMGGILADYQRLDVPEVYEAFTTSRLLVMQDIEGVPVRQAPEGPARKEAARQLLESYYRQIMTEGFFHADPHPGNLLWWKDTIYFLDFGMVGEVGPDLRESMMLLLMSFWQEDVGFLMDTVLALAGGSNRSDIDADAFRADLGNMLAKYRNASLRDLQLGPILQELTELALRYEVPLPASLTLTAKAMAQMQLTAAEMDPELDPFEVAGSYLMRDMLHKVRGRLDPRKMFYETQKLRVRLGRLIESVERLTGARPGPRAQVNFRAERLEQILHRTGRLLSLAITASTSLFVGSQLAGGWQIGVLSLGGVLGLRLLFDVVRRERS